MPGEKHHWIKLPNNRREELSHCGFPGDSNVWSAALITVGCEYVLPLFLLLSKVILVVFLLLCCTYFSSLINHLKGFRPQATFTCSLTHSDLLSLSTLGKKKLPLCDGNTWFPIWDCALFMAQNNRVSLFFLYLQNFVEVKAQLKKRKKKFFSMYILMWSCFVERIKKKKKLLLCKFITTTLCCRRKKCICILTCGKKV